jgi:hypothetical protein
MRNSAQHRLKLRSKFALWVVGFVVLFSLGGCSISSQQTSSQTDAQLSQKPTQSESPSLLSYGSVTSSVKKGTTTQADLGSMFGGPNISTIDSDGNETWIYEKTTSETTTNSQSSINTKAERLDVFFGLGFIHKGKGEGNVRNNTTVSSSIKSLTVIIKFNQDKTVKDYSARASYF